MWFDDWQSLWRVAVLGTCAYAGIVAMLRVSGKRTLAKMNAFDFVVTIAFGSILASTMLSKTVTLVEGLTAFAVLIALQYVVAWLAVRVKWFEDAVKSEPALLAYQGRVLRDVMRRERITERELECAVRESGYPGVAAVDAVILETDGTFSIITRADDTDTHTALEHVAGFQRLRRT